jgi:hypothetical protein
MVGVAMSALSRRFMAFVCFALAAGLAHAGEKLATPKPPEIKPKTGDKTQQLLAEREKAKGPSFIGKDAAFLILPREPERLDTPSMLLNPEVKEMTRKSLEFLLRSQNPDGSWSDTHFPQNTGVTALCCLALIAEGNQPRVGPHGHALNKGIEYILKSAQDSGIIAAEGSNKYGPMYEHALSTVVLVYAYGNAPWHASIRNTISKALQSIERSQRLDGGWRYQFSREGHSDVSITAVVLWALRTAKKAGFSVQPALVANGIKFIEQCGFPDGSFRYRLNGIYAAPSVGGACMMAMLGAGKIDNPMMTVARDRIVYDYQRYTVADLAQRRYFAHGAFFASLAMYMSGDTCWVPWFKKTMGVFKATQVDTGEFRDESGNTIYPTAMCAIVLQAPLGYLPLYER